MENELLERHSLPIIHLFKGVLYSANELVWKQLIQYPNEIKSYFSTVGIDVVIDESEGFAFLTQKAFPEDINQHIPKLIEKRQLSYPVSLMCILLRKKLLEFEKASEEPRLIVSLEELQEMSRTFFPDNTSHEKKVVDKIEIQVKKLIDLGFLRELKNEENKYEVSRILKAYLPIEKLQEALEKLKEYHAAYEESIKDKKKNELDF